MAMQEYFATGPAHERPVFDVVHPFLVGLDPDITAEFVSVGVFYKRGRRIADLRPMSRWVALSFKHPRRLVDRRITRKPFDGGGWWWVTVNLAEPSDFDHEVRGWLVEAVEMDRLGAG